MSPFDTLLRMTGVAAALCAALLAQAAAAGTPARAAPRTAYGRPSLEGVWASNALLVLEATPKTPDLVVPEARARALAAEAAEQMAVGFESSLDPEAPAMLRALDGFPVVRGQRRTRLVIEPADGRLPYTAEARRQLRPPRSSYDNPEDRPAAERCLAEVGPPPLTTLNYANRLRIVQTRDHVVLHTEYGDEVRIVPFAAAHGPRALSSQLGDSIARWEGDTLVIETVGLPASNQRRMFPTLLVPPDATVIERFTRPSKDELDYQFTIVDPKTFSRPWLAEFSWFATAQPMFEHACHEGNYSLPNILAGARHDEAQRAAKAAAEKAGGGR
ncbi:MAG: hypothetical protein ACXWKN_08615 [Phenylobacterium sp.]